MGKYELIRTWRDGTKVVVLRRRDVDEEQFGKPGTGGHLSMHQLKLRQYRERRGLSQEKLAWMAGLSVSGYRKIETGLRGGVRLSTLERLAYCLGVQIKDLL